jgi:hypothetical protein
MRIYGVDFSGARDPSGKLYVASGTLSADRTVFTLEDCEACDDRLDVFARMLRSPADSVWGLDVPFAPAAPAYKAIGFEAWEEWLAFASASSRSLFLETIESVFPSYESPCTAYGWACRHTDVACRAQSPFKRVNPNLRAMVYAGWKLLHYARQAGFDVYPFDGLGSRSAPALFEIYPSHTARLVNGRRRLTLSAVAQTLCSTTRLQEANVPETLETLPNQDAADACVACLTLAATIAGEHVSLINHTRPSFIEEAEWRMHSLEGLIVRLPPA